MTGTAAATTTGPAEPGAGGLDGAGPAGRRERLAACGLLLVMVALFHGPSLRNGFVYDDHWTIVDNPFLRQPANVVALAGRGPARAGVPDAGRPALVVTEIVDHALWGLWAPGFHLQNVLWHAGTTLLFFLAAAGLTGGLLLPFTAAALFAVHPLGVEAVAAVNYREDLLAAFFTLAALVAVLASRRRAEIGRVGLAAAAFVLTAIACFAKESAYIAPVLLVVVDLFSPPHSPVRAGRLWSDVAPLVAAVAMVAGWRVWVMGGAGIVSLAAELPEAHRSPLTAVPRAALAFVAGLADVVFPWKLSPDYADPAAGVAPGIGALLVVLGLLAGALWQRRRLPWVALGLAAAVVAYLPVSGLVPLTNLRADRYFYLPSLGLFLAAAALLVAGMGRLPWLHGRPWLDLPRPWVLVSALALALGMASLRQARFWRSDLTLWTRGAEVAPGSPRVWRGLAEARLRLGDPAGARDAVERSLSLARDAYGRELLGIILMEQGELESARSLLARALAESPPHQRADRLNNLGRCELVLGLIDRAVEHLAEARRLAPRAERPAINLAAALQARGDTGEALRTLRALVASVPASREGWRLLGVSLEAHGDTAEALAAYQRADALGASDPRIKEALERLSRARPR